MQERERRAFSRVSLPFDGRVTFSNEGNRVQRKIETRNISASGGYFLADVCPPVGVQVELFLHWSAEGEESEIKLTMAALVLRVDELEGKFCGFAVRFEGTPDFLKG